jgi:hypothetical protein
VFSTPALIVPAVPASPQVAAASAAAAVLAAPGTCFCPCLILKPAEKSTYAQKSQA